MEPIIVEEITPELTYCQGNVVPKPSTFPLNMKALGDCVCSNKLKLGIFYDDESVYNARSIETILYYINNLSFLVLPMHSDWFCLWGICLDPLHALTPF